METGVARGGAPTAGVGGRDRPQTAQSPRSGESCRKTRALRGRACGTSVALVTDIAGAHDDHRLQQTRNRRQQTSPGATNMSDTMIPQVEETPKVVAVEGGEAEAALGGVAGGVFGELKAKGGNSCGVDLPGSHVSRGLLLATH